MSQSLTQVLGSPSQTRQSLLSNAQSVGASLTLSYPNINSKSLSPVPFSLSDCFQVLQREGIVPSPHQLQTTALYRKPTCSSRVTLCFKRFRNLLQASLELIFRDKCRQHNSVPYAYLLLRFSFDYVLRHDTNSLCSRAQGELSHLSEWIDPLR